MGYNDGRGKVCEGLKKLCIFVMTLRMPWHCGEIKRERERGRERERDKRE